MRGLGRLFALPWLLAALAVQSLAPAETAAMRPDAAVLGICSAHELGRSHRHAPSRPHDHDCCAFACAIASLAAAPPAQLDAGRVAFAAPGRLASQDRASAPNTSPLDRPRARDPPAAILTT